MGEHNRTSIKRNVELGDASVSSGFPNALKNNHRSELVDGRMTSTDVNRVL